MRSGIFLCLAILAFQAILPSISAGNLSGNVLLKAPSSKPASMAEAVTSLDAQETGVYATSYNPAATADLLAPQMALMGQKGILDDAYGSLFYGHPTPLGAFSLGMIYYSLGNIELINTFNVSRTVKAQEDYVFSLTYAENFFETLSTGLTFKYLNSQLVDAVRATSYAFDIGVQNRLDYDRLGLGFSILNIGSNLQYLQVLEPLPLTVRLGGSYRFNFQNLHQVMIALDLVKELGNDLKEFFGVDYVWNDLLSVRSGYKFGQDEGAFSTGLGFMMGGVTLDYALTIGNLGQRHSASLIYRFSTAASSLSELEREKIELSQEIKEFQKSVKKHKIKVALLGLNSLEIIENSAAILEDKLFVEFRKVRKVFDLQDPQRVQDYIRQSDVDLAQCTEVECLKKVGADLGVEKIITGFLTLSLGQYSLTLQMLNVKTGFIEVSEAVKAPNMTDMEHEIRSLVQSLAKSVQ